MRRSLLWMAVIATPLLITGCKKKAEPAPAPVEEAPPPAVNWSWGTANFNGSRDADTEGTLTVRFDATNQSDTGLVVNTVAVHILDASGEKICGAKASNIGKAPQGVAVSGSVDIGCDFTKLPESGPLSAKITAMYTVGEEEMKDQTTVDLTFKR
jgi:hypothetical protein